MSATEYVTKEDFQAYENVRQSGKTNMFAIDTVKKLSGLSQEQTRYIMHHYGELCTLYPDVRFLPKER